MQAWENAPFRFAHDSTLDLVSGLPIALQALQQLPEGRVGGFVVDDAGKNGLLLASAVCRALWHHHL